MSGLTIDGNRFRRDGRPEFVLADTAWAAIPRATAAEWDAYVSQRRRQGFTAVLLSILPIPHGRSSGGIDRWPFGADHDRDAIDASYLSEVRAKVTAVVDAGLTPFCVLVWNNYVPHTWGAERTPGTAMTEEQTIAYAGQVLAALAELPVVWLVSGDESFTDPRCVARYSAVLDLIRRTSPGTPAGAHAAVDELPPDTFADRLDFHTYQSGHDAGHYPRNAALAARLRRRHAHAPILNLEPPYEHHMSVPTTNRHSAVDVRRASWASVLGGATAGLGYGAHGVWSWHHAGDGFSDPEYAGVPADVQDALRLPGADDVAFLRTVVEEHDLFDVAPRPGLAATPDAPIAATEDLATVAVLATGGSEIRVTGMPDGLRATVVDLDERRTGPAEPSPAVDGGAVVLPVATGDRLYLFRP